MGLLGWIVLGLIVGWIASVITKSSNGMLTDLILGVVGAVVGGFLMNLFGQPGVTGFNIYSFIVALIGSIVLIWIGRALTNSSAFR